jgi:hypothetical protein
MVQTMPRFYGGENNPLGIPLTWASGEVAAADGAEKVLVDMSSNPTLHVAMAFFNGVHGGGSALGETHLYSETAGTGAAEFNWYGYYQAGGFPLNFTACPWVVGAVGDDLKLQRIVTTGNFHWIVGYFFVEP